MTPLPMPRAAALAALLAAPAAAVSATPAAAQTSYPLICRAGGEMHAAVRADGMIRLFFAAGTAAGASTPPAPGQCTWLDRGFRAGEPLVLQLAGNPGGVRYLVDGLISGGTFFAHVYNNGAGAMVVTRVGP
ncbi:MAG: hypothetical protein KJZ85_16720 [Rhodobacteraceae bacterium]|jgi:hypothetical protein|nr:hypothetical protein [Paracoccaceae bacterium]